MNPPPCVAFYLSTTPLPRLEIQLLLAHALGVPRSWLLGHDRDALSPNQVEPIEALLRRRLEGEPMAYILGRREFYGRDFQVRPGVLIPRPETELLLEQALERLPLHSATSALDIGTGSGVLAISLALERPNCRVTACDISPAALDAAGSNAHDWNARVELLESDVFARLPGRRFDLIVSNPPYIAAADPHLTRGDLRFEPPEALASGPDGLDVLERLIAQAPEHLHPGGALLLEHGWDQGAAVRERLIRAGFAEVFSIRDLAGHERVSGGHLP